MPVLGRVSVFFCFKLGFWGKGLVDLRMGGERRTALPTNSPWSSYNIFSLKGC